MWQDLPGNGTNVEIYWPSFTTTLKGIQVICQRLCKFYMEIQQHEDYSIKYHCSNYECTLPTQKYFKKRERTTAVETILKKYQRENDYNSSTDFLKTKAPGGENKQTARIPHVLKYNQTLPNVKKTVRNNWNLKWHITRV